MNDAIFRNINRCDSRTNSDRDTAQRKEDIHVSSGSPPVSLLTVGAMLIEEALLIEGTSNGISKCFSPKWWLLVHVDSDFSVSFSLCSASTWSPGTPCVFGEAASEWQEGLMLLTLTLLISEMDLFIVRVILVLQHQSNRRQYRL